MENKKISKVGGRLLHNGVLVEFVVMIEDNSIEAVKLRNPHLNDDQAKEVLRILTDTLAMESEYEDSSLLED